MVAARTDAGLAVRAGDGRHVLVQRVRPSGGGKVPAAEYAAAAGGGGGRAVRLGVPGALRLGPLARAPMPAHGFGSECRVTAAVAPYGLGTVVLLSGSGIRTAESSLPGHQEAMQ